jgi:adenylyltransferase/sulfurtransferase
MRRPRALVVGGGGLGGPIALALGADGVDVTIVDPDVVELSNLHRQIAFTGADLGRGKAQRLATLIARCGGTARACTLRFDASNAAHLIDAIDVVVDGCDDPPTKFLVADVAGEAGLPHVIAGALGLGGNLFVGAPGAACYRCLFEEPPVEAASCSEAGVLGPIVAWIGGAAARHARRLLAGDRTDAGSIWIGEQPGGELRAVRLARRPGCACEGRR